MIQYNDDEDRRSNNRRQIVLQVGCWPSAFPISLAHNPDIGVGPIRSETSREVSNPQLDIATRNGLEISTKPRPGIVPHNRRTMIDDHTSLEFSRLGLTSFTNPSYMLDHYRFEWFRILVALVAWLVTDLVALDMYFLMDKTNFHVWGIWISFLMQCVTITFLSIAFTSFFIFLQHFHQQIGDGLERYCHVGRATQRHCLRIFAYLYIPISLCMFSIASVSVSESIVSFE